MRLRFSGRTTLWALILSLPTALVLGGCHSDTATMDESQKQTADRLGQIKKSSGGDWEKVSAADRDFLLQMVHGNEHTAKMLITSPPGAAGNNASGSGPIGTPPPAAKSGAPAGQ